jgi:hypothetical protein
MFGMIPLIFLLLICTTDPHRLDMEVVRVHDLATLAQREATALDGKRALFRVWLDSDDDQEDDFTLYDCQGPPADLRSVWLYSGQGVRERMTVEATLRVIRHPPALGYAAFVEYRLTQGIVRPGP